MRWRLEEFKVQSDLIVIWRKIRGATSMVR